MNLSTGKVGMGLQWKTKLADKPGSSWTASSGMDVQGQATYPRARRSVIASPIWCCSGGGCRVHPCRMTLVSATPQDCFGPILAFGSRRCCFRSKFRALCGPGIPPPTLRSRTFSTHARTGNRRLSRCERLSAFTLYLQPRRHGSEASTG